MRKSQCGGLGCSFVFLGSIYYKIFSVFTVYSSGFVPAFAFLQLPTQFLISEGDGSMKVVVVRSPKVLKGILRLLFGIKKQDAVE